MSVDCVLLEACVCASYVLQKTEAKMSSMWPCAQENTVLSILYLLPLPLLRIDLS
ncbi:hypothetical protein TRIUR3_23000 [Triticum urartu]|uniref:Uncharacterized protein n=1 Tax=Triticum urartu TaxID=4572 RepID=M7ZM09_TRIUA|nr:hypothetical protein TRIUR3_23000 [Triticum urartu]